MLGFCKASEMGEAASVVILTPPCAERCHGCYALVHVLQAGFCGQALRQRKLRELQHSGVPTKYCAELARKTFISSR